LGTPSHFLVGRRSHQAALRDSPRRNHRAWLADDVVAATDDPYPIIASLMTLLKQRGWNLDAGYDPENPKIKETLFIRPELPGLDKMKNSPGHGRDSRPPHRGGRPPQRDSKPYDRKPRDSKPRPPRVERTWLTLSLGKNDDLKSPGDLISLVCQTAGIKKTTIGKIDINDSNSRFELNVDCVETVKEGFERRKAEPKATVTKG